MMNSPPTPFAPHDPSVVLDRHSLRRATGVPTVSVLVGPIGAGGRAWGRWAAVTGRSVVAADRGLFPYAEWLRSVAAQIDLLTAAVKILAQRAGRAPDEFLAAWRDKTFADRELFWSTLAATADDDLLRAAATLPLGQSSSSAAALLTRFGEPIVPAIIRLFGASIPWPSVLFVSSPADDFSSLGHQAAKLAMQAPELPIAIAVSVGDWSLFLDTAPESRVKAILREGELAIPVLEAAMVERTLAEAGAVGKAAELLVANGADAALVEAAAAAARATAVAPKSKADADGARSAAEHFLFKFLESIPETAGRFQLNASLDFSFGPRPAEVDLLCREPRIALEVDGYFHFIDSDAYRRDRAKDWELQRRGYLVLRFLAEDIIPRLELVRDRLVEALTVVPNGGPF
jgi:hypothetical protein